MTGFSADWLALRDPADIAARSARLAQAIARVLSSADPVRALDLAAGTGSNTRYLADYLTTNQQWLLVDHDPQLLHRAAKSMPSSIASGGSGTTIRQADLRAIAGGGLGELFEGRELVTASALLDLVSDLWLREAVARCREQRAVVLFALSYDGRMQCTPEDPGDARIRDLVNEHQRGDKGFGPALGPGAVERAVHWLTESGYSVQRERSDWILTAEARALQRPLIDGWADAAAELAPAELASIRQWQARRLAHVDAGRSRILVGHEDVAGFR